MLIEITPPTGTRYVADVSSSVAAELAHRNTVRPLAMAVLEAAQPTDTELSETVAALDATNSSESPNGCPADTAPMVVGEPTGPDADALARVNAARDATEECKAELRAPPKGRTCMDCWESFNTDGSDWLGCWSQVGLVRRDAPACDNFVPRSATPNTPEFPDGCCIDAIRDAIAAVDLEPPTHSLEELVSMAMGEDATAGSKAESRVPLIDRTCGECAHEHQDCATETHSEDPACGDFVPRKTAPLTCADCRLKVTATIEPLLYTCSYRSGEFPGNTPVCEWFEPEHTCGECEKFRETEPNWCKQPFSAEEDAACSDFSPRRPELLPCPFCGLPPLLHEWIVHDGEGIHTFSYVCDSPKCDGQPRTRKWESELSARDAWNRRVG